MKQFCTKFQKSIIFLIELVMYALAFITFFALFSIDNPEIADISRTAAVTLSTYVFTLFFLTNIYGGFDVAAKRRRDVVLSLFISEFITDLVTYFELTIMKTNEANNSKFTIENVGILALVIVIQLIICCLFTIAGSKFYFWINEKEKCVIVAKNVEYAERVHRAFLTFKKRYTIDKIISEDDENLYEEILKCNSVVIYEADVNKRTEIIDFCYKNLKNVYFNPSVADILEQNSKYVVIDDISFFSWQFHLITFEQRIVKRLMDICISSVMVVLLSPVLLICALLIKSYDKGKVFFVQDRATANGKVFKIYKFRTMKENVENRSASSDDDRITPVGKFLRKYRIDELPQLFNIIKGDMSLVGPRPEMMENVNEYTKDLPEFAYRLRMKAGLTGLAQIFGKYNTSSKDKLMLDLMYIENYSILKDIQLLFQTVFVLFKAEESTKGFDKS